MVISITTRFSSCFYHGISPKLSTVDYRSRSNPPSPSELSDISPFIPINPSQFLIAESDHYAVENFSSALNTVIENEISRLGVNQKIVRLRVTSNGKVLGVDTRCGRLAE